MTKEKMIDDIYNRYKRKVIAYPDPVVTHFGDCDIYAVGICTCGLLSDLGYLHSFEKVDLKKIYPDYDRDYKKHKKAMEKLWED